jgi:hypothetical protein
MADNQPQYQRQNTPLLQRPQEDADVLLSATTIESRTPDGKGHINANIAKKFDSLLSPIISIGNYADNNKRSQMYRASFTSRRTQSSYPSKNYSPLTLPNIESAKGVVLAKITQGSKGDQNILRVLRSAWSHVESVTTSKHEEKLQAKGRVK